MAWYRLSAASLFPRWRLTTLLMWGIWMGTSAGALRVQCTFSVHCFQRVHSPYSHSLRVYCVHSLTALFGRRGDHESE